jgi:hypothetical protein
MRRVTLGPGGQGPLQDRISEPPPPPPPQIGGPPPIPWSPPPEPEPPDTPEPAQDWDYTPLPPGNGSSDTQEPDPEPPEPHPEVDLPPLILEEPVEAPEVEPPEPPHDAHPEPPPGTYPIRDAADMAHWGRAIEQEGIKWVLDGMIPDYGLLGFIVGFAKTGKTTFGQTMGDAISKGEPFIGRATKRTRVLYIAAEDPPEYTAWIARGLNPIPGMMGFICESVILGPETLAKIAATVKAGRFGLVLIASWQAVIRELIKDENDNAGAAAVVERVKATVRLTGVPWLIDAHSGKDEKQENNADPLSSLRGASAAPAAADFLLWLRYYKKETFGTKRRLSGKGRFVSFEPLLLDYAPLSGAYSNLGTLGTPPDPKQDATWEKIDKSGALTTEPKTIYTILQEAGYTKVGERPDGGLRKKAQAALKDRPGVIVAHERRDRKLVTTYRRGESAPTTVPPVKAQ